MIKQRERERKRKARQVPEKRLNGLYDRGSYVDLRAMTRPKTRLKYD